MRRCWSTCLTFVRIQVTAVGAKINNDPDTKDYLKLFFLPDYNVSLAEVSCRGITPAHSPDILACL